MNGIQTYVQQDFTEFKKFEGKDMSYSVFKNIDFYKYMHPVSFFRTDFRGTKFTNTAFFKNNFDRSDFLNSIFIDCSFNKVQFGCCQMKNCYFKNAKFTNNFYRNTSIHSTTFVNCEFPDEAFLINMQHCRLIDCTLSGCSFEMSTTDSDTFENCIFIDTNIATMHAENHRFVNCHFKNVCIDSSYFFGYSIAKCKLDEVIFLYRGEYVRFEDLKVSEFLEKFEREHRFNDMLNLFIYTQKQNQIPEMLKYCLEYYAKEPYGRMLGISDIFENLSFAAIHEIIDFKFLQDSLDVISEADFSVYNFDERIEIEALHIKLKNSLYLSTHSKDYLAQIGLGSTSLITIKLNSDDYELCIETARQLFDSVSDANYWTLIEKEKGSWILVYSAATIIVLAAIPKIVKNYADIYFEIKAKKFISKKIFQKLENTDVSLKDLEKITATTKNAELLLPAGKCINKDISKEIASITANL